MSTTTMNEVTFATGQTWEAEIIGQKVGMSKGGDPQVVLDVNLLARLSKPEDPQSAHDAGPQPGSKRIWITNKHSNDPEQKLKNFKRFYAQLRQVGFTSEDIELLNPDNEGFVNLVGQKIYVSCRLDDSGDKVKDWWDLKWFRGTTTEATPSNQLEALRRWREENRSELAEAFKSVSTKS